MTLSILALVILCVAVLGHVAKHLAHPGRARQDLRDPALVPFYGQPAVTVLLAAEVFAHRGAAGVVLTVIGTVLALASGVLWLFARASSGPPASRPAPPQLIPGIACLMIPLTATSVVGVRWCWLAMAIGLTLLAMVYLSRPVPAAELPAALAPTMAIHLAAPAVASLDLLILAGDSPMAIAPLGADLVVFAWLGMQLPRLLRAPFGLPWWAYTMPFSAVVLGLSALVTPTSRWWPVLPVGLAINVGLVAIVATLSIIALARGRLIPLRERARPATPVVAQPARDSYAAKGETNSHARQLAEDQRVNWLGADTPL